MEGKFLEEFPNYRLTECGKIFNKKGKVLKWATNIDGYYTVTLYKDGKGYVRRRARLLAQTFIPNPDNLPMVNHIDHDRKNDNLSNLEWVTAKENVQKSLDFHPEVWKTGYKIGYEEAHDICKRIEAGHSNPKIAKDLELSIDVIKHIRRGNTWTEVSCNYEMKGSRRGVSVETVIEICKMINSGYKNREIISKLKDSGVTKDIVKEIRAKKSHRKITKNYLN